MQQHARYQQGSLSLEKRATGPDIWTFRYYVEGPNGRVYRKQPIGDVQKLPKRKDAEKAIIQLRINMNEGAAFIPRTIAELVAHLLTRQPGWTWHEPLHDRPWVYLAARLQERQLP